MKVIEKWPWLSGALLIAVYFIGQGWPDSARHDAIDTFDAQKQQQAISQLLSRWAVSVPQLPDARVERVEPTLAALSVAVPMSLVDPDGNTIAALRIPRSSAEVTVD